MPTVLIRLVCISPTAGFDLIALSSAPAAVSASKARSSQPSANNAQRGAGKQRRFEANLIGGPTNQQRSQRRSGAHDYDPYACNP